MTQLRGKFGMRDDARMFLRQTIRRKDGKAHRYWSVVENRRLRGGGTAQKTLLYLGEINDSQQAGWCKAMEAVAGDKPVQLCLFPADRQPPAAVEHVQIRMDKLELKRPRQWGACWLALELWARLRLDAFWGPRLPASREGTRWLNVLKTLVSYRLIDPPDPASSKRRHGYSRDKRSDCVQVVIALVVTPEGFPLAYEVLPGNTKDKQTLRGFLRHIETRYGKAQRIWVMDRGVPTEEVLTEMRQSNPPVHYLVGTPKGQLNRLEAAFAVQSWEQVRDRLEVKLLADAGEAYVLARSGDRVQKERAIRNRKLKRLWRRLKEVAAMKRQTQAQLLMRLGAAKQDAGQVWRLVRVETQPFSFALDRAALRQVRRREGRYVLRTNLSPRDPATLWRMYMRLGEVEQAFKELKNDLGLRPIHHRLEHRIEAHVFVAFMAYCLQVTLKNRLRNHAGGLTSPRVIEQLAGIQMLDVQAPTTTGKWLTMSRYTQPDPAAQLLISLLERQLPPQHPPRISPLAPVDHA